jgi:hypothetical protein
MKKTVMLLVLGIGATILLAEGLLRIPAVADAVPERNPYYHGGVQPRIDALEALLLQEDVDVLFIGSSVTRSNVSPHVFDDVVSLALNRPIVSFNVGGSGLYPDSVALLYEHLWSGLADADYVVQFVRYAELRSDTTAKEFFADNDIERAWVEGGIVGSTRAFLQEHSALYRRRGVLSFWLTREEADTGFNIDDRGHEARSATLSEALETKELSEITGYEAVESGYRGSLDDAVFATGLAALQKTADLAKESGVTFVVANMPEHPDKFLNAPDGQERYEAYLDTLRRFARDNGVAFLDVTGGDPTKYSDIEIYADFHHFTETGAVRLSEDLAEAFAIMFG